ncbi:MAG TPA: hypothetical protein VNH15_02515 [Elusimicrobiota bacterium]|nr:hypothetical protein [Elusimicrobiota bacterium]
MQSATKIISQIMAAKANSTDAAALRMEAAGFGGEKTEDVFCGNISID